ncbi:Ig-like domain repeat protein|nr:Ig-like domain repeat protein [Candidatus Pantoea persica]
MLKTDKYLQITFDNGATWETLLLESGTEWRYPLAEVT